MVETYNLSHDITMIVTNENHPLFDEILDRAREDYTNPLYKNYINMVIEDFVFVNLFSVKDVPAGFCGMQQKKWMPSYCARAYARTYKLPEFRLDNTKTSGYGSSPWKYVIQHGNYDKLSHWWRPRGISTLLVTRNVDVNRPDAALATLNRYTPNRPWKKYPHICMIQNTLQYVYWYGKNEREVDFLQEYHYDV